MTQKWYWDGDVSLSQLDRKWARKSFNAFCQKMKKMKKNNSRNMVPQQEIAIRMEQAIELLQQGKTNAIVRYATHLYPEIIAILRKVGNFESQKENSNWKR